MHVTPKDVLLASLAVMALAYAGFWVAEARRRRAGDRAMPTPTLFGIGFLTDFLDTLGLHEAGLDRLIRAGYELLHPGIELCDRRRTIAKPRIGILED